MGTGSAVILIDEATGENAIVVPGACFTSRPKDVEAAAETIRTAGILLGEGRSVIGDRGGEVWVCNGRDFGDEGWDGSFDAAAG